MIQERIDRRNCTVIEKNSKRFIDLLQLTLGGGDPQSLVLHLSLPWHNSCRRMGKHIAGGGSFNDEVYYDGIALSRGDLLNDSEVIPGRRHSGIQADHEQLFQPNILTRWRESRVTP